MKRFYGKSSNTQIYSENTALAPEPTKEEINDFAHRIGIDPEAEPHLLSLAKEGLLANLPPNWKPCFDDHKQAWYYYDTTTQKSQWTHPMDEIFKDRAAQARSDLAFNKLQNFDLNKAKPPKALPPLKGLGGLSGKLGLGINDSLNPPQGMNLKGPIGSLGSIKSSGLTITGGGSNFLKTPSSLQIIAEKKDSEESDGFKLDGSCMYDAIRPLKSILAKSATRLEDQKSANQTWKSEHMNDDEFKIWETLTGAGNDERGRRSNVKFNLEENSEIHFDISSQQEDPKSNETGESEDESETDTDESERIEISVTEKPKEQTKESIKQPQSLGNMIRIPIPAKQPIPEKRSSLNFPHDQHQYTENNSNNIKKNFAAGENSDPKATDSNLSAMRAKNEERLQDYQDQLDRERKQKENLLRKNMEASLDEMKTAHDEKLENLKDEFEREKKIEIERRKSEFDSLVREEVNRISDEVKKSIKKKREEMYSMYEKAIQDYKSELNKDESEKRREIIKMSMESESKSVEKEVQSEMKKLKEIMKDDQKKQIQQMKDYHYTIIEKMKQDFKREEEELKRDHEIKLASIVDTFDKERKRRMAKLKNDHETELDAVKEGFLKEISTINSKNVATKDALLEEKETEISVLKNKVFQLEEKYNSLKQELHTVVEEEMKRNSNANPIASPTHSGSTGDQADPDSDLSVSSMNKPEIPNIMDMIDENHERLNDALLAFENLKEQIVQLKGVQKSSSKTELEVRTKGRSSRSKSQSKNKSTRLERSSSAIDMRRLQQEAAELEMEEELRNQKCIEEAKNFILSQRYRLEHPSKHSIKNSSRDSRPNVFPSENSTPKHGRDVKYSKHGLPIPTTMRRIKMRQEAPSETESSGVGSLLDSSKNRELGNKKDSKQLNKDIDGILDSLKKLDGQMKYLWNVVGTSGENDPAMKEAYLKAFSSLPFRSFPTGNGNELFQVNRPSTINELAVKYLRPASVAPYTTNIGSSSFGSSHNMFNSNPIIGPLENQFRDYRLTQNRVMAISEYFTPMELEKSNRKTSVVEKTKDLREWLEKI